MRASYEVGLNCGLSCRALVIWKEVSEFWTNDRLGYWGHLFLCFSLKSFLLNWDSTTSLGRMPLTDWKTITLWWGLSRRFKFLGWNLLHGEWIWSPTGWLQSWAFKCFLGPGWGCPLCIVTDLLVSGFSVCLWLFHRELRWLKLSEQ